MKFHAHVALCDRNWIFLHESITFDVHQSMEDYLNVVYEMFDAERIPRETIKGLMVGRLDINSSEPIYFLSEKIVYLWVLCNKCRLSSLN